MGYLKYTKEELVKNGFRDLGNSNDNPPFMCFNSDYGLIIAKKIENKEYSLHCVIDSNSNRIKLNPSQLEKKSLDSVKRELSEILKIEELEQEAEDLYNDVA